MAASKYIQHQTEAHSHGQTSIEKSEKLMILYDNNGTDAKMKNQSKNALKDHREKHNHPLIQATTYTCNNLSLKWWNSFKMKVLWLLPFYFIQYCVITAVVKL